MRVLVADKDPHELDSLRSALEAADLHVTTAADGRETIELARKQLPDVVVVNSSLGSMGGFATSRELKMMAGEGLLPEPKIVVLLERAADVWLAGWSRCDRHVIKPVDGSELAALVRELAAPPGSPFGIAKPSVTTG